jgi:RNA polymerase sigma-70 factor (ECF subfamily)
LVSIKKHKKLQSNVPINEYTEHEVKAIDNALDIMEAKERSVVIKNCIEKLPSEDAFLMTLYYYEELSLDEIADITGLKANNVKVKLFRSRKKLATILKKELDNETIESYGTTYRTAFE